MPAGGTGGKKVTATLDIQAQITNYQEGLIKLQNGLNSLHLPEGLKKGFNSLFVEYQAELEKLSKNTANGKLSVINEKEVEKSFERIEGFYTSLIKKLNGSGYKASLLEKDFKAIQAITSAEKDYNAAVKKAQKELDDRKNKLEDINRKLERQKALANEFNKISVQAANTENAKKDAADRAKTVLEQQKKVVEETAKAQKEFKEDYVKAHGSARGWNTSADAKKVIQEAAQAQQELVQRTEEAAKAEEEYAAAQDASKTAIADAERIQTNYEREQVKTKVAIEEATKAIEEQEDAVKKLSSQALEEVRKKLQESGVAWKDYGIDPSTIKSYDDLQAAIKRLKEAGQENVAKELENISNSFQNIGTAGKSAKKAFDVASVSLHELTEQQKEVDRLSQSILRFFSIDNAVRLFKRSIRSAYETIQDLDKVMTETAVVTEFSVGDMWSQLPEYTKRANELGVSIHSAYEAATIYYQQGLKTNEVMQVSNQTLKMARIAGLEAAEATDRMTNALRGFNMEINEANATRVADVYSKLAAISASNVDEISTAMTKVASLASNANMEFETTAAFLSQIIETTRESAETAGTALKTVVARFSEVKKLYSEGQLTGSDEEGQEIDVNKVSTALRTAGINLNDYLTGAKGLDDIFIELASKWDSLDKVQQRYIATMAAGSRQQSRFIAMMSDYKRTQELVTAAENAAGASNEQYQKTLDSLETKLNQLKNAWDEFTMSLANSEVVKFVVDAGTTILNVINKITGAFGEFGSSFSKILLAIGGIKLGKTFFNKFLDAAVSQFMNAGKQSGQSFVQGFTQKININNFKGFFKKNQLTSLGKDITDSLRKNSEPIPLVGNNGLIKIDSQMNAKELAPYADSIMDQFKEKFNSFQHTEEEIRSAEVALEDFHNSVINGDKTAADSLKHFNNLLEGTGEQLTVTADMAKTSTQSMVNGFTSAAAAAGGLSMLIGLLANGLDKVGASDETVNAINDIAKGLGVLATILATLPALLTAVGVSAAAIPVIGWIAAAITLITTLGFAIAEFIESDTEKAERLKKQTEEVQKAAEDAKQAYDDLMSGSSDYEGLLKELEELDKGTKKWKEKLEQVNDQVLKLIEEYPELAQYLEYGEGGLMTLNSQGLEEYKKVVKEQGRNAQLLNGMTTARNAASSLAAGMSGKFSSVRGAYGLDWGTTIQNNSIEYQNLLNFLKQQDFTGKSGQEKNQLVINAAKKEGFSTLAEFFGVDIAGELTAKDESQWLDDLWKEAVKGTSEFGLEKSDLKQFQSTLLNGMEFTDENSREIAELLTDQLSGYYMSIENATAESFKATYDQFNVEKYEELTGEKYKWAAVDAQTVLKHAYSELFNVPFEEAEKLDIKNIKESLSLYQTGSKFQQDIQDFVQSVPKDIQTQIKELLDPGRTGVEVTDKAVEKLREYFKDDEAGLQQINNIISEYTSFLKGTEDRAKELQRRLGLTEKTVKGLDSGEQYRVTKQIQTLSTKDGEENSLIAKQIDSILEEALKRLSDYDASNFLKDFTELDVLNTDSLYEFAEKWGLEVTQKLVEATDAAKEFDVSSVIEKLQEVLVNTKDFGTKSSFSNDDMALAIRYGAKASDFQESNGEWRYIGKTNQQEWASAIGQAIREAFQTRLDVYNDKTNIQPGRSAQALETAENAGIKQEDVLNYAKTLEDMNQVKNLSRDTALSIASDNLIAANSFKEIQDNWEDLRKGLTSDKSSVKYAESLSTLREATKKMIGANKDLSEEFLTNKENLELFDRVLKDEEGAFEEFRRKAIEDIVVQFQLDDAAEENVISALQGLQDYAVDNNLEIGAVLNDSPYLESLNQMLNDGKLTVEQMNDILSGIGWEPEITYAEMPLSSVSQFNASQDQQILVPHPQPDGTIQYEKTTLEAANHGNLSGDQMVRVPIIGSGDMAKAKSIKGAKIGMTASWKGTGSRAGITQKPKDTGGKGGGGSSKSDKAKNWKNPYDELYNLEQEINETTRQRNLLEAEYDLMLNDRTKANDVLLKNSYEQLKNLEKELVLQKEMQAGRKRQLDNILNETYEDSEGNRKTYKQLGVEGYARYDQNAQTIVIDWEGLEKLAATAGSEEKGKAVEDYIKRLEELSGQFEEIDSKVLEIEKQVQDIRMRGMDAYTEMQERVLAAFIKARQDQIDEFQALSDTIADSTSRVIDGIREQVEAERQARQNEKAEEDIADKEARLAYLQRDTSGANDLEIMKLNEELADARQDYTDSLIDQGIEKMQEQADKAQEQRQRQIDLMTAQLALDQKNGYFNEAVQTAVEGALTKNTAYLATINTDAGLIKGSIQTLADGSHKFITDTGDVLDTYEGPDGGWSVQLPNGSVVPADLKEITNGETALKKFLEGKEGVKAMTAEAKWQWESSLLSDIKKATEGWANFKMEMAKANGSVKASGKNLSYKNGKWYDADGNEYDVTWNAKTGAFDAKLIKNATTTTSKSNETATTNKGTTTTASKGNTSGDNTSKTKNNSNNKFKYKDATKAYSGSYDTTKSTGKYSVASLEQMVGNQSSLKSMFDKGNKSQYIKDSYGTSYAQKSVYTDGGVVFTINRKLAKYKSGGLVDFTGPAWLDGSKSNPELIFNAEDSKNFITLKDILSQLLRNPIQSGTQGAGGDNYYEINIDAEIANDYDVDRLASRIKQQIYSDSMYRNVNTLNWQR